MRFSLIVAIYGVSKLDYIEKLIESIIRQTEVKKELIIVDQNSTNHVEKIINKYFNELDIIFLKSNLPGLSRARNLGLVKARYEIVAFPDDDCQFSDNILLNVRNFFINQKKFKVLICGVRETIKKYKLSFTNIEGKRELSYNDIFICCCSISIFHLNESNIRFDESFGLGAKYNSSEDYDYVLQIMNKGSRVFFNDELYMLHPDSLAIEKIEFLEKVKKNSIGHGAFFRKHFRVLWKSTPYYILSPLIGFLLYYFTNKFKSKTYFFSFQSRLKGFIKYK